MTTYTVGEDARKPRRHATQKIEHRVSLPNFIYINPNQQSRPLTSEKKHTTYIECTMYSANTYTQETIPPP